MKGLRRWEIGVILGVIFVLATVVYAQFVYESVTISSTATTLTSATYKQAKKALITCETNSIRFTLDGTQTPTSAGVGHLLYPGQPLILDQYELRKFKAVRASGTDATIKVTYY